MSGVIEFQAASHSGTNTVHVAGDFTLNGNAVVQGTANAVVTLTDAGRDELLSQMVRIATVNGYYITIVG